MLSPEEIEIAVKEVQKRQAREEKDRLAIEHQQKRTQKWLSVLEEDKVRAASAPLPVQNWQYRAPGPNRASSHLAYYFRTGKKFMDFDEASYRLQERTFPVVNPYPRCRKCKRGDRALAPRGKLFTMDDLKTPGTHRRLALESGGFPNV